MTQNRTYVINNSHPFWTMNPVFKRLNSFATYQLHSLLALFIPNIVEKALFSTLSEQFILVGETELKRPNGKKIRTAPLSSVQEDMDLNE